MNNDARIILWGKTIGAITWLEDREIGVFQYAPDFLLSGIQLAPLMMPLNEFPYEFPALARNTFKGLPGLVADSLPDKYGNALIDAWLASQGRTAESFHPVERLCYIGSRGMGALEYEPATLGPPASRRTIEVAGLVDLANKILAERTNLGGVFSGEDDREIIDDILRVGTSAGGARAKAILAWNRKTNEFRSGRVVVGEGYEYWMMKFDGITGSSDLEVFTPKGYGKIEYAYHLMALKAGIEMAESRLHHEGGHSHFMTKRFDRSDNGKKLHMQSLGAIAHYDYKQPASYSYEQAIQVIRRMELPRRDMEQLVLRAIFNIVSRNCDDHVKNIAFLMDQRGEWRLSPAFDISYSWNPRGEWTSKHQMSINGKRDGFEREDLVLLAKTADIKKGRAEQMVQHVIEVVLDWSDFAMKAGVNEEQVIKIQKSHRTNLKITIMRIMKELFIVMFSVAIFLSCSTHQQSETDMKISKQDNRLEWWRDARFGMFIHWGLYAQPAGEWKGEQIPGISEWIMARAKIPVKEYENLTLTFNPEKYNADDWVKLAKQAGMKYIVITSKHHDGFAMFHSKASKYNIVDATPFKRDPLKELAEACEKNGMRLGFYYSQAQDWHEPGGTYFNIEQGEPHWDPDLVRKPLMNYIKGKAVPQVNEILENYGGLDILWWDTPRGMTEEAAQMLKDVTDQYPEMITNNRLYRPWPGDFSTPEQHVPPTGLDYDWEVCMTMNTSWGYKHYDDNWKSSETLIRMLVDIASKGGNLLLNVGPTAEGLIPEPSVERLKAIGEWMEINSESIYGTDASPFFKLPWGRCTRRETKSGTTLYLHVFNWPEDQVLRVPGLKTRVKEVYLLSDKKQKLSSRIKHGDLMIDLPAGMPDPINTVIVVESRGNLLVTSNMPSLKEGIIELPANFADIHNPGYGKHIILEGSGENATVTNWVDPQAWMEWMFRSTEPGTYNLIAFAKANEPSKLTIEISGTKVEAEIRATNGEFQNINLGKIEISDIGDLVLALRPIHDNWKEVELAKVELITE